MVLPHLAPFCVSHAKLCSASIIKGSWPQKEGYKDLQRVELRKPGLAQGGVACGEHESSYYHASYFLWGYDDLIPCQKKTGTISNFIWNSEVTKSDAVGFRIFLHRCLFAKQMKHRKQKHGTPKTPIKHHLQNPESGGNRGTVINV